MVYRVFIKHKQISSIWCVIYIKDIFHVIGLTNTYSPVGNILVDSMLICSESISASVRP